MPIFVTEQLGPTQSLTPEGYLLCADVPIARTGSQIYMGDELPGVEPGRDGLITAIRDESEVFRPETIASFEGKSVTVQHQFVNPDNVKRVEVGHAQNVRRSADMLVADLLIKDARAIELVRGGLREISCGYDAAYVQDEPGIAYQRNIIGNHVALVERGRAGSRCSIQDGEPEMKKKPNAIGEYLSKLVRAVKTGDAALIKKTADEAEEAEAEEKKRIEDEEAEAEAEKERKETADQIAALAKTVDTLAEVVAKLAKTKDEETPAPDDDEDEAEKTATADAMRDTASRAEVLVPGFAMPTADSVTDRAAIVAVQRKVLTDAMKTADGRAIVAPLIEAVAAAGIRTVDGMSPAEVAGVFRAASEMAKMSNNARGARRSVPTKDFGPVVTAAEINRRNAEFYAVK